MITESLGGGVREREVKGGKGREREGEIPTFQSSEVTSLLLGTSWPPSRMQWRSTSCVEVEALFSFRFQIRAVESPELKKKKKKKTVPLKNDSRSDHLCNNNKNRCVHKAPWWS